MSSQEYRLHPQHEIATESAYICREAVSIALADDRGSDGWDELSALCSNLAAKMRCNEEGVHDPDCDLAGATCPGCAEPIDGTPKECPACGDRLHYCPRCLVLIEDVDAWTGEGKCKRCAYLYDGVTEIQREDSVVRVMFDLDGFAHLLGAGCDRMKSMVTEGGGPVYTISAADDRICTECMTKRQGG